jgi:hypothetical protein
VAKNREYACSGDILIREPTLPHRGSVETQSKGARYLFDRFNDRDAPSASVLSTRPSNQAMIQDAEHDPLKCNPPALDHDD